tara:strand:+ start:8411 stop:8992 length:582 start_codon:yes stop_codon:yes gene_type:complete
MNKIIQPGSGILFMKIGTHASEDLANIIQRKSKEIDDAGYAMWGYGGNTCHPSSMVQPFAQSFAANGKTIHLVMEQMNSNHFAEPLCAAEFSADGIKWEIIPDEIQVRGSRFALVIDKLHTEKFMLPLDQTRVPVGPSTGRIGSKYISGRVDKACLELLEQPARLNDQDPVEREISLVAELRRPYAVFLRNYR